MRHSMGSPQDSRDSVGRTYAARRARTVRGQAATLWCTPLENEKHFPLGIAAGAGQKKVREDNLPPIVKPLLQPIVKVFQRDEVVANFYGHEKCQSARQHCYQGIPGSENTRTPVNPDVYTSVKWYRERSEDQSKR